jgi:molybdenum cofactor synthesis domain-containing protein
VAVITVSDRASRGEYEDRSGPAIVEVLAAAVPELQIERRLVPDDEAALQQALVWGEGFDVVVTTGGTGLGPRDLTPDVTRRHCDREVPGIAEALRRESYAVTRTAVLSRGYAGSKGGTLYVNLPGSVGGARDGAAFLAELIPHAVDMLGGGGHG